MAVVGNSCTSDHSSSPIGICVGSQHQRLPSTVTRNRCPRPQWKLILHIDHPAIFSMRSNCCFSVMPDDFMARSSSRYRHGSAKLLSLPPAGSYLILVPRVLSALTSQGRPSARNSRA